MDAPSASAPTSSGLGKGLLIFLVMIALLVALAEGGARVKWTRDELDPYAAEMRKARVTAHPYLAYANKRSYEKERTEKSPQQVSHNSHGFRGPEFTWEKREGVFRILCLGGSSTYGFGPSSDSTTWPVRLQLYLNETLPGRAFEVINGGCQGYSTFESLINLELRGTDLRPDLVLVYHSINDMRCALYPHVERDNSHWRAVWPVEWPSVSQRLLEKSFLFLAWRRYRTDWWAVRQDMGSYVIKDFGKYRDFYAQADGIELGFANIQRNLINIVETARRHGAPTLLVTQGMKPDGIPDVVTSKAAQLAALARMSELLFAVGEETGSPVLDAAPVLEAAALEGREIFTNEVHMTDEGADLLARTLATGIVELGLAE